MSGKAPAVVQRRVLVSGKVQGVFFRANTAHEAERRGGLKGFVRNLPDGRVEAVFCGPDATVSEMVEWCRHGPPTARVTGIEVLEEPVDPALGAFAVR